MFGQTPDSPLDSMTCYTPSEMRVLAVRIIDYKECDTLNKFNQLIINALKDDISSQDRQLVDQENRYKSTERLAKEYQIERDAAKSELKKARRKIKWIKVGWATTAIAEAALIIYFMIK